MEGPIADDGLTIPEVGAWSKRKYHFLARYVNAFTTAMRKKWNELHYIDLFAGAGLAKFRGTGEIVRSSALIAACSAHPFSKLHLADASLDNCNALRRRLEVLVPKVSFRVLHGDANVVISELLEGVPSRRALCLTFADPFGLHFDFETAKTLAKRQSDLLVLVADNMDALRNWSAYYKQNPESSLDKFMGESGWRDILAQTGSDHARRLRERYKTRLQTLGYAHFREIPVQNSMDRAIYTLLFASRHDAGAKIWDGISKKDESGQMNMEF